MKNEHLLELELHEKVPNETGAYSWTKIKRCPNNGDLYQDFCMDYGCEFMQFANCLHPSAIVVKEGYKKS